MSASFDPNLTDAKDRLRAALGDRDMTAPLRSDEEYWAQLDITSQDERLATAVMAEGLAAEFGRKPTTISSEGDTISWAGRINAWLTLAKRLYAAIDADAAKAAAGGFGAIQTERECRPHSEYTSDRYTQYRGWYDEDWRR